LKGFVAFTVFQQISKYSPHDFAVRSGAFASCATSVHRIPWPNVRDDRETPLLSGGDGAGF
ncbi:hypothetical protein, partial [Bradyrhizobium sp.]|uniref:hypothetical protein n=1 Tax=Bradyrhizobium sp. TaxID=376 RepID=UPI003C6FA0BF